MEEKRLARKAKQNLFEAELQLLTASQSFLEKADVTLADCKRQLEVINTNYEDLLDQSKLITKVSFVLFSTLI